MWEAIACRQGVINAAAHSPQMGGKTDAWIAPKQTIMVWRLHFMAENYEADLLNENHSKYKSGV